MRVYTNGWRGRCLREEGSRGGLKIILCLSFYRHPYRIQNFPTFQAAAMLETGQLRIHTVWHWLGASVFLVSPGVPSGSPQKSPYALSPLSPGKKGWRVGGKVPTETCSQLWYSFSVSLNIYLFLDNLNKLQIVILFYILPFSLKTLPQTCFYASVIFRTTTPNTK